MDHSLRTTAICHRCAGLAPPRPATVWLRRWGHRALLAGGGRATHHRRTRLVAGSCRDAGFHRDAHAVPAIGAAVPSPGNTNRPAVGRLFTCATTGAVRYGFLGDSGYDQAFVPGKSAHRCGAAGSRADSRSGPTSRGGSWPRAHMNPAEAVSKRISIVAPGKSVAMHWGTFSIDGRSAGSAPAGPWAEAREIAGVNRRAIPAS